MTNNEVYEIIEKARKGEELENLINLNTPENENIYAMVKAMITCANCGERIINGKYYICDKCADKIKQEIKGSVLGNILENSKNGDFVASYIFSQIFGLIFGF